MGNFWLNRTIKRIEREANDDLRQVLSIGAHYYSTSELNHLLDQLEWQRLLVSEELKLLYRRSAAIPFFFLISILFVYFQLTIPAFTAAAGMILLLGGFFVHSLAIRRRYPTYYFNGTIEKLIHQELEQRRYQVDTR